MVYFIQVIGTGEIKIGHAEDPRQRLIHLQTACPYRLELLGAIPGGVGLEKLLQRHFVEHRIRGEWFRPAEELVNEIRQLLSDHEAVPGSTVAEAKAVVVNKTAQRLTELLRAGPMLSAEVCRIMESEGFRERSIVRARKQLHVIATKELGSAGAWWIRLPETLSAPRQLPNPDMYVAQ